MRTVGTSAGEGIFRFFNGLLLVLAASLCLYPFLHVAARSVSSEAAILRGAVQLLPEEPTLQGWRAVRSGTGMGLAFRFTVVLTLAGTVTNVFITVCGAYPLSKRHLRGRKVIWPLIIFTMFFSGGLIPVYLVVKSLGLIDSIWALILPGSVSTFNLIITRTFFCTIPESLEESARLEGCNDMQILYKIIVPLSMAMIATITLFYAVGHWNCYQAALFYIQSTRKYPLQLKLRMLVTESVERQAFMEENPLDMEYLPVQSLRSAATIYAIVPILVIYPWLQRYFVKGVLIGSLRE